jgi:1,4-dihydroxy-2-naphthoyl-CoA hydrolase
VPIWKHPFTIEDLDKSNADSAAGQSGIRFTRIGENWLEGELALDERTAGADSALHPGAFALLAETIGSVAANLCVEPPRRCLGQNIDVLNLQQVRSGSARARAVAASILDQSQICSIEIKNSAGAPVALARLTMAVVSGFATR